MGHIFFSYAREDRRRAELLATAFQNDGWSVWWDRAIPAGTTFDEVIEEALDAASCVIVLWSEQSTNNRWVRSEAEEGAVRNVLVPVLIERVKIPLAFRRIQAADLVDWGGDRSDPNYRQLLAAIARLLSQPATSTVAPFAAAPTSTPPSELHRASVDRHAPSENSTDQSRAHVVSSPTGVDVRHDDTPSIRPAAKAFSVRWLRRTLFAQMCTAIIAVVAGFVMIDSIVGTLPALSVIGIVLIVFGFKVRWRALSIAGAVGPALGLLCTCLIWYFDWGPSDASGPIGTVIALVGVPYIFWLFWLARRWRGHHRSFNHD